jgi:hypothetical protein
VLPPVEPPVTLVSPEAFPDVVSPDTLPPLPPEASHPARAHVFESPPLALLEALFEFRLSPPIPLPSPPSARAFAFAEPLRALAFD